VRSMSRSPRNFPSDSSVSPRQVRLLVSLSAFWSSCFLHLPSPKRGKPTAVGRTKSTWRVRLRSRYAFVTAAVPRELVAARPRRSESPGSLNLLRRVPTRPSIISLNRGGEKGGGERDRNGCQAKKKKRKKNQTPPPPVTRGTTVGRRV